jgi:predicted membrane-bound spermidine synthase
MNELAAATRTKAVAGSSRRERFLLLAIVIFDTFTLGFITLGFEMVAGRILTPLFGSGIYTWATIISLVVAGLMFGYFIGGFFADRYPSFGLVALIKIVSGLYLVLVYYLAGGDLEAVLSLSDDEIVSLFISGFIVCFPPLLVLGMFSPLAVRLVLADPAAAGRVAGGLFALSSFGNILGILATTFLLIPNFGSRAITLSFGLFALVSGVLSTIIWLLRRRSAVDVAYN